MSNHDSISDMKATRASVAAARAKFDEAAGTGDVRTLARGLEIMAGVLFKAFDDMIAEAERRADPRRFAGPGGGKW